MIERQVEGLERLPIHIASRMIESTIVVDTTIVVSMLDEIFRK
jgi:hypothetical protein